MFSNYLKIAFRNLLRYKGYSFINILGLGLSITCVIITFVIYTDAVSFNAFHKNGSKIYNIVGIREINDKDKRVSWIPLPVGSKLMQDCPQIQHAVGVEISPAVVRFQNQVFNEYVHFADDGFFEMFTFPLLSGTAVLKNRNQVVISEKYAKKYFGQTNPIGQTMTVTIDNVAPKEVTISGVMKQYPYNSSLRCDILGSSELLIELGKNKANNWKYSTSALFIQIANSSDLPAVEERLKSYLPMQIAANPKTPYKGFLIEPLNKVAENTQYTRGTILYGSTPDSFVVGMGISAIMILLMACINYINLALASSVRRLKEIGVRKVIGGGRMQLIIQFLSEHLIICIIALILGFCLAEILTPGLNSIFSFVQININSVHNINLMIFLVTVIFVTGIGAGLYPAYVISSYNPVSIFMGKTKQNKPNLMSRIRFVFGFAIAMEMVIAAIVFDQNAQFNKNIDVGYEKQSVITVPIKSGKNFTILENEIRNQNDINGISGSVTCIGYNDVRTEIQSMGEKRETQLYVVGFNYVETMKLRLKEGRSFNEQTASDTLNSVLINESLEKEMGWTTAIGKTITIKDNQYQVVGVVGDFFNFSTWKPIMPSVFRVCGQNQYNNMHIRLKPGCENSGRDFIKSTWVKTFPDIPYEGTELDPWTGFAIQVNEGITKMNSVLAIMSIVIAIMSLFAFVSSNTNRRKKEVGIRKVFGASVFSIIKLVNRDLVILLISAAIVADVGGYFLLKKILDSVWVSHTSISFPIMIIGNFMVFLVVLFTVGWQIWKTATANPVESLKYE
jgi:putative ABC transport system permease protein